MSNMTKTNVVFDRRMMGKLPKSVGYSGLFRWAMHLALDTDKEFQKACVSDAGLAAADRYMVERVRHLIGK